MRSLGAKAHDMTPSVFSKFELDVEAKIDALPI